MSHHTVEERELHRQMRREGGRERWWCVSSHRGGWGNTQIGEEGREGERKREIMVSLITPWRMGKYTDR